mgnify:CR=1 FL=1
MTEAHSVTRLLIPSHVMSFLCSQCGECCTSKWRISVDRPSYDELVKKLAERGRQEELDRSISEDKKGLQIRFSKNGTCPYLTNHHQCSLQLELGAEYLLDICKVFPRIIYASRNTLEFSLAMTCKTAIQTLLHGPIRIIEVPYPVDTSRYGFSFIEPLNYKRYDPDQALWNHPQLTYRALESKLIEVMQSRPYSMRQRLIRVGQIVARAADENAAQTGDILQDMDRIPWPQPKAEQDFSEQLRFFYQLSKAYLKKFPAKPHSQLLRTVLLTLSGDQRKVPAEPPDPDEYQKLVDRYLRPALAITESMIENYLVNAILGKQFYSKSLPLAYYRLTFMVAAATALSVAYGAMTTQPVSQQTMVQAIYDSESIFYSQWFYPYLAFWEWGNDHQQIIHHGLALVR